MSGFKRISAADLATQLQSLTGSEDYTDVNEWRPTTDKMGNGSAVIRFLPAKVETDTPFVKVFSHGFKHNSKWYVENCPTTIGQECPACKANSELWNSGIESDKEIARGRKRKLSYWANIVVIKDEAKPENQGKVFKYRFGQKIMDKIVQASSADADLGTPGLNVTCPFTGANFSLKIKQVSGFANYDDSKFGVSSELFDGDEAKLDYAWNAMHDIAKISSPSEFKTFAELETKLTQVIGQSKAVKSAMDSVLDEVTQSPKQKAIADTNPSSSELDDLLKELDLDME